MPNFSGMRLTRHGMELLGLVGTGTVLDFTRVAVGSGTWDAAQQNAPAELIGLVKEEMSLDIGSIKPTSVPDTDEPAGAYTLHVMLTNTGLASGFNLREIGIFATHPTRGEILYAVAYAGDQYDYIPQLPAGVAPLEKQFRIDVVTGNAREITIKQAPVLLATHDDMSDHNTNPKAHPDLLARLATGTPEILFPAAGAENIGETPIYRFRQFAPVFNGTSEEAIQVQIDLETGNFSNPVHDSGFLTTIAAGYEQPAGMLQAGETKYKIRYRRRLNTGQISEWSEVIVFETRNVFNYVSRPSNVSPSNGATGVMETPKLVSSAFAVVGDANDTHEATQYRMRIGDTVLHLSPELGAVTEYDFPAGLLLVSGDYVWETRYKGAALGWSEWSTATSFHTAVAFVTGDEALSFTSWDGYDNASAAGVALTDDAALRSNGVDQGELEGDWTSFKVREKVRAKGLVIHEDTTSDLLVSPDLISKNYKLATDLGIVTAGDVTTSTVSSIDNPDPFNDQSGLALYQFNNNGTNLGPHGNTWVGVMSYIAGKYGAAMSTPGNYASQADGFSITPADHSFSYWSTGGTGFGIPDGYIHSHIGLAGGNSIFGWFDSPQHNGIGYLPADLQAQLNSIFTGGWHHICLVPNENGVELWIDGTHIYTRPPSTQSTLVATALQSQYGGTANQYYDQVRVFNRSLTAAEIQNLNAEECTLYSADISSANFASAPTRAHKMPTLAAATGPAGPAFTADDFNEIAVETATLGTDVDPDRPDFILLESAKITPATPFRRVALGVSGLSKDSETRISETQCDTWKVGA